MPSSPKLGSFPFSASVCLSANGEMTAAAQDAKQGSHLCHLPLNPRGLAQSPRRRHSVHVEECREGWGESTLQAAGCWTSGGNVHIVTRSEDLGCSETRRT